MQVILNSGGYTYDVHSLVKAFFPHEEVKVLVNNECENADSNGISVFVSSGEVPKDAVVTGYVRCTYRDGNDVYIEDSEYCDANRPLVKSILKRVLYKLLSERLEIKLPWGTLTGIRPTKIPMSMIREGASGEEIAAYMEKEYLCSPEKIKLSTDIARRELKLIDSLTDNGFSLYIGIPFCPTTCLYCSFTSYPIVSWKKRVDEYIAALKKEIDFFAEYYKGRKPDSIYIGGGTPTTLEPVQLAEIINYVKARFDLSSLLELTVEAGRPDSITTDKLKTLYSLGVTRISINPQTMNEETLKIIGRRHTVDDIYVAYEKARSVGFENINMDLILGLPGEGEEEVAYTFNKIRELAPDSITVHSMAIKRAAGMNEYLEKNHIESIITPNMMKVAGECAKSLGMVPYYLYRQKNMTGNYENVGFAKEGKFGVYNIIIMEEITDIAACGAGTVSKKVAPGTGAGAHNQRIERCDNVKDVGLYIEKIDEMIGRKRELFAD